MSELGLGDLDPHVRLRNNLTIFLENSENELIDKIPNKWLRLGDLILLPETAFKSDKWAKFTRLDGFWESVANALKASRIGRQAEVDSGPMRESNAELLLGENGWVNHKEHGVIYCFDATKVMFSAGNISERGYTGKINASGEIVVDLYCGIGYYSLPLLVHSDVEHVHACEINPHSIAGLKLGLEKNNVSSRCTIHEGNNQDSATKLEGIADRVLLGLLPSSKSSWGIATRCLKKTGGRLHVHMNVIENHESDIETWAKETAERFGELAKEHSRDWNIEIEEIRKVKWYAPHVRHCNLILSAKQGSA